MHFKSRVDPTNHRPDLYKSVPPSCLLLCVTLPTKPSWPFADRTLAGQVFRTSYLCLYCLFGLSPLKVSPPRARALRRSLPYEWSNPDGARRRSSRSSEAVPPTPPLVRLRSLGVKDGGGHRDPALPQVAPPAPPAVRPAPPLPRLRGVAVAGLADRPGHPCTGPRPLRPPRRRFRQPPFLRPRPLPGLVPA